MTGIFQIYIKKPKPGEVHFYPPTENTPPILPDKNDISKFDFELLKEVELFHEVVNFLDEWMLTADFCEEFIVRCELPT